MISLNLELHLCAVWVLFSIIYEHMHRLYASNHYNYSI